MFGAYSGAAFAGSELVVRLGTGGLQVAAPGLHFIAGRPLERLKNGSAVAFDFQLSVWVNSASTLFRRALERFVVSYDLWEEKFAVTRVSGARRSVSHLSATAAEAWCVDNIAVPPGDLAPDRQFWMRLELRVEDAGANPAVVAEPGISLSSLVEIFSRNARAQQPRWLLVAGPVRLADLQRNGRSGPA
jgi:hypothetical protein